MRYGLAGGAQFALRLTFSPPPLDGFWSCSDLQAPAGGSDGSHQNTDQQNSSAVVDQLNGAEAAPAIVDLIVEEPKGGRHLLEQINLTDSVAGVRHLIANMPALCHHSCYHLVLVCDDGNASIELNDLIELGEYPQVKDRSVLKIVLDRYDVRTGRLHVKRFRHMLNFPPPGAPSALTEVERSDKDKPTKDATNDTKKDRSPKNAQKEAGTDEKATAAEPQVETAKKGEQQLVESDDMSLFYPSLKRTVECLNQSPSEVSVGLGTSTARDMPEGRAETSSSKCIKSVAYSGWNPPPPQRKLMGDLFYLEVVLADNSAINITCTASGFYVNRCQSPHSKRATAKISIDDMVSEIEGASNASGAVFNPLPKKPFEYAHSLVELLRKTSPTSFSARYEALMFPTTAQPTFLTLPSTPYITLLAEHDGCSQGLCKQPWLVPETCTPFSSHAYDAARAEDELCNTFGMEDCGSLRDWNEEYQCCNELPSENASERLLKSRAIMKIVSDFIESATLGATAIVQGQVLPINIMDPVKSHVYVFNNIFFSIAMEGRDTFKDVGGNSSAY
jgi:protein TIF31